MIYIYGNFVADPTQLTWNTILLKMKLLVPVLYVVLVCLAADAFGKRSSKALFQLAPGKKATSCACGNANRGRVVGGKLTGPNEYPWIVMLVWTKGMEHFCDGSIVSEKVIISAAHCAHPVGSKSVSIIAGSSNVKKPGQVVAVSHNIMHEKYDDDDFDATKYDIALFILKTPLRFNQNVGPICLPATKLASDLDNKWVKILGWGMTGMFQPTVTELREADVQVLPLNRCKKYFSALPIPQIQICTLTKGKGGCTGDSGGPVVYLDPETNRYTLVGLVSFGSEKCDTDIPTVSTDVSSYLDWIKSKGNSQGCRKL